MNTGGEGISMPEVGRCTIQLDNDTGIFDVTDTSGALYPYVIPGAYARLRVRNGEAGTTYNVFTGIITSIEPVWGGSNPKVQVVIEDGWRVLNDTEVNLEYVADCTSSMAVASILTAANYPAIWGTTIQTGDYQIKHFTGVKNKKASDVIKDVINFEFGSVAVANNGKFIFRKQSQTSSPAFTISQEHMLKDIQVTQRYNSIRNVAKIIVYPKKWFGGDFTGSSPKVLWTLDETPLVASHDTYTVWGDYEYLDYPAIVEIPDPLVASTDYTMNDDDDGTGTDRTGQFVVSVTPYADRARFDVYNAGTHAAYITLLQIQGEGYYSPDPTFFEADTSTTTKRLAIIDSIYQQTIDSAHSQAIYLLNVTDEEILPRFQMEARPERQFGYDLLDEVTLTIPKYKINGSYFISHIEGQWLSNNGQSVLSTFTVETAAEGGIL